MDVLAARKEVLENFLLFLFGEFNFFFVIVGHDGRGDVIAKHNYTAAVTHVKSMLRER